MLRTDAANLAHMNLPRHACFISVSPTNHATSDDALTISDKALDSWRLCLYQNANLQTHLDLKNQSFNLQRGIVFSVTDIEKNV